jgi:hypothetical protein
MIARLLRLHPSTYKRLGRLSKEAERDGAYRVAKRLQAVVLNSEGHSSGELARILKAPRSKVSEWLARYQAHGVEGLLEGQKRLPWPSACPEKTARPTDYSLASRPPLNADTGCGRSVNRRARRRVPDPPAGPSPGPGRSRAERLLWHRQKQEPGVRERTRNGARRYESRVPRQ